jgi:hypothetical protein
MFARRSGTGSGHLPRRRFRGTGRRYGPPRPDPCGEHDSQPGLGRHARHQQDGGKERPRRVGIQDGSEVQQKDEEAEQEPVDGGRPRHEHRGDESARRTGDHLDRQQQRQPRRIRRESARLGLPGKQQQDRPDDQDEHREDPCPDREATAQQQHGSRTRGHASLLSGFAAGTAGRRLPRSVGRAPRPASHPRPDPVPDPGSGPSPAPGAPEAQVPPRIDRGYARRRAGSGAREVPLPPADGEGPDRGPPGTSPTGTP